MKKKRALFLALVMLAALLTGCSSGVNSAKYDSVTQSFSGGSTGSTGSYEEFSYADSASEAVEAAFSGASQRDFSEKMIYSASATVETTSFDETVNGVYAMLEDYGAFLESSYVTGQSYSSRVNGYVPRRSAEFVIRVPVAGFDTMTKNLAVLGNVLELRNWSENITVEFYDAQSRLDTYRTEESRVLAMLEKADTVSDMLELESRLSDIRYNIESLETRLRNWQNQVDYSTLNLSIREVEVLTETVAPQLSYWEQIGQGLLTSLRSVGRFFKDLFRDMIVALPILVTVAVCVLLVVLLVKALRRANARRKEKKEEKARQKAFEKLDESDR